MSLPTAKLAGRLEEKQKQALISLLADDDAKVYQSVRSTILSYGPSSAEWMQKYALSSDPVLRRRAAEIINHFARQEADTQFLAFCLNQGEDFDLEQGVLLLSKTQYPAISMEGYSAVLDDLAGDLRERLNLSAPADQMLRVVNDYVFRELRFTGDEKNFYDPENSYFTRVIDRRTGNVVSLCLFYLLLTRRLQLPVTGIGLPGHFLCRYQSTRAEIYIDVFHGGRMLAKMDCVKHVIQLRQRFDESCLAPVSSRRILLRICATLHQVYTQRKSPAQIERLQRYLVALAK